MSCIERTQSPLPRPDTAAQSIAGSLMLDVWMLVIGGGFFALTIGYCFACDRL